MCFFVNLFFPINLFFLVNFLHEAAPRVISEKKQMCEKQKFEKIV